MTPQRVDDVFASVGFHVSASDAPRAPIGSKGIGRFSVFSLGHYSDWTTVAKLDNRVVRQSWTMSADEPRHIDVEEATLLADDSTGTRISIALFNDVDVQRLCSSIPTLRRTLFNAFAAYMARYGDSVAISVNGVPVTLDEYVDEHVSEVILESDEVPGAELHHMLLGQHVEVEAPSSLVFSSEGATIKSHALQDQSLPGRKYLGVVDSAYLTELAETNKADLAEFDQRFQNLQVEAANRAHAFIESKREGRRLSWLEIARAEPFYPYRQPARTLSERLEQSLYDNVLVAIEENVKISELSSRYRQLIFTLAHRLLRNEEDLASVLTEVLGLRGQEVERLADLLRQSSLSSLIAVMGILFDRLNFLDELEEFIYGLPMAHVKERSQLQKIIEMHTWLFGEQYHLMGADQAVSTIMNNFLSADSPGEDDPEEVIEVSGQGLELIPDLYLFRSKKIEGPNYYQHLIVELKAPKVRIVPKHIDKLKRYAEAVVQNPRFSQAEGSHHFQFVILSSDISERVRLRDYQRDKAVGLIGEPGYLGHPTELWALRWSDYIDQRRSELSFLRSNLELTSDPAALKYLKESAGEFMPEELGKAEPEQSKSGSESAP